MEQVWVAAGTYKPTFGTDRSISFTMKDHVAIYGGFVGIETALSQRPVVDPTSGKPSFSTLSGDIGRSGDTSDNSYHMVNSGVFDYTQLTNWAVLDGFVIAEGNANRNGLYENRGGGLLNSESSPSLFNCSFLGNSAINDGGGLCIGSGGKPNLTNCLFETNSAFGDGGEAYSSSGNITVGGCQFRGNSATNDGGLHNSVGTSIIMSTCKVQRLWPTGACLQANAIR